MATFKEIQAKTMNDARKQGLSEEEAISLLRSRLKRAGVPFPKSMATDEEYREQQRKSDEFKRKRRKNKIQRWVLEEWLTVKNICILIKVHL